MKPIISKHAAEELARRGIPQETLQAVLDAPEQKVPGHGGITCYQSKVTFDGKSCLLRAMVDAAKQPPVVVTVYRTSKIAKYWSQP